jgi:hypothetical protein
MQVTLEIPDASASALRDEYRRRLGNQFPQVKVEDPGPKGTVIIRHEDDPDVDPLVLWLEDFAENEVIAADMTAARQAADAAEDDDARKDALLAADNAERAKVAVNRSRQLRGAQK